jgi:CheY-like chemotaxis protein
LTIRAKFLEQFGCSVIAVQDRHAALKAVTENEVDIALIDYHLGDGATGEQVINDIRVVCPHIRIILFSGDPNIPESAKRGADAVLTKGSSNPRELLGLITSYFETRTA